MIPPPTPTTSLFYNCQFSKDYDPHPPHLPHHCSTTASFQRIMIPTHPHLPHHCSTTGSFQRIMIPTHPHPPHHCSTTASFQRIMIPTHPHPPHHCSTTAPPPPPNYSSHCQFSKDYRTPPLHITHVAVKQLPVFKKWFPPPPPPFHWSVTASFKRITPPHPLFQCSTTASLKRNTPPPPQLHISLFYNWQFLKEHHAHTHTHSPHHWPDWPLFLPEGIGPTAAEEDEAAAGPCSALDDAAGCL